MADSEETNTWQAIVGSVGSAAAVVSILVELAGLLGLLLGLLGILLNCCLSSVSLSIGFLFQMYVSWVSKRADAQVNLIVDAMRAPAVGFEMRLVIANTGSNRLSVARAKLRGPACTHDCGEGEAKNVVVVQPKFRPRMVHGFRRRIWWRLSQFPIRAAYSVGMPGFSWWMKCLCLPCWRTFDAATSGSPSPLFRLFCCWEDFLDLEAQYEPPGHILRQYLIRCGCDIEGLSFSGVRCLSDRSLGGRSNVASVVTVMDDEYVDNWRAAAACLKRARLKVEFQQTWFGGKRPLDALQVNLADVMEGPMFEIVDASEDESRDASESESDSESDEYSDSEEDFSSDGSESGDESSESEDESSEGDEMSSQAGSRRKRRQRKIRRLIRNMTPLGMTRKVSRKIIRQKQKKKKAKAQGSDASASGGEGAGGSADSVSAGERGEGGSTSGSESGSSRASGRRRKRRHSHSHRVGHHRRHHHRSRSGSRAHSSSGADGSSDSDSASSGSGSDGRRRPGRRLGSFVVGALVGKPRRARRKLTRRVLSGHLGKHRKDSGDSESEKDRKSPRKGPRSPHSFSDEILVDGPSTSTAEEYESSSDEEERVMDFRPQFTMVGWSGGGLDNPPLAQQLDARQSFRISREPSPSPSDQSEDSLGTDSSASSR